MITSDYDKHCQTANERRSPEIQAVLSALLHVNILILEDASDYDLSSMSHAIELIQREIHLRYFIQVDRKKFKDQWFTDRMHNSRTRPRRR
jgi:hypothetical protein